MADLEGSSSPHTPIELIDERLRHASPQRVAGVASASAERSPWPRRSSSTTCATPRPRSIERGRTYNDFDPTASPCRTPPPRWRCCSS